jgi:hypothetical protein
MSGTVSQLANRANSIFACKGEASSRCAQNQDAESCSDVC